MPKMLLIGNDFGLLSSRASLLAKTEAEVTCCCPNKVSTLLESNVKIYLVVLCHSVHGRVGEVIMETIRVKRPQARILQVTTDLYESSSYAADATAESDPPKFIQQVTELLGAKPAKSEDFESA